MKVSNRPKVVNICSNDNIPLLLKQHNFNSTDIIISSYKITDHIGKGNFGDVYCGKYISN